MLLTIDVGNSQIHFALFGLDTMPKGMISHLFHLSTHGTLRSQQLTDEILNLFTSHKIDPYSVKKVFVSSVVPSFDKLLISASVNCFKQNPEFLTGKLQTGLNIMYKNSFELGADRIANAAAAYQLYGGPYIIVDFGTATTYCVITETGEYLGGLISLGLQSRLESLSEKTGKLPNILIRKPEALLGQSTVDGMLSGAYYGAISELEGLVQRLRSKLDLPNAKVLATGGLANLIAGETSIIDIVDVDLTLKGLEILYYKNKF